MDGKTHATFARLQLEHGDCLSQRTLRLRHTTQLRNFDASAGVDDGGLADASELALFSEPKAKAPALAFPGEAADPVAANTCDILQSGHGRYVSGRLMATLSLLSHLPCIDCIDCKEADARLFLLPILPEPSLIGPRTSINPSKIAKSKDFNTTFSAL